MSTRRDDSLAQSPFTFTRRQALALGAGLALAPAFSQLALAQTRLQVELRQHPADPDRDPELRAGLAGG